jgi:replicative DNA helicase
MKPEPCDLEAEAALVGRLIVQPYHLRYVLGDLGFRDEWITDPELAAAFTAIASIRERGEAVIPEGMMLAALHGDKRVRNPERVVTRVFGTTFDDASIESIVDRLQDVATRRRWKQAAQILSQAAETGDRRALVDAENLLTAPHGKTKTTWSPEELQSWYFDQLQQPAETWPWPFKELNRMFAGGLRREEFVLIGGWSSHGKTVILDQFLRHFADQGLRVHLYMNEMGRGMRVDRQITALSGVPANRIRERTFEGDDRSRIVESIPKLKIGLTNCSGWTAGEIARHIRLNSWDIAGVDILHNVERIQTGEPGAAEVARTMRTLVDTSGTAVLGAVHLNDARATTAQHPVPVGRDIRDSGMFYRLADDVLFIFRDEDADGERLDTGLLIADKVRDGETGRFAVKFNPETPMFEASPKFSVVPGGVRADQYVPHPDSRIEPAGF